MSTIRAAATDRGRSTARTRTRLLGAAVAAAISLSLLVLPSDAALRFGVTSIGGLGLIGAPLAALLGFVLTPSVVRASWPKTTGLGIAMGLGAAYVGVLELAMLALIASVVGLDASSGLGDDVPVGLFIAVVGLPFGTLVLPITIPCGLAWALIMRMLTGRGVPEGRIGTAAS